MREDRANGEVKRHAETIMDAEQLKSVQAPLKDKYRQDPQAAPITLRAEGRAAGLSCKVETGKALVEAGLHPATGGDGTAACSDGTVLCRSADAPVLAPGLGTCGSARRSRVARTY